MPAVPANNDDGPPSSEAHQRPEANDEAMVPVVPVFNIPGIQVPDSEMNVDMESALDKRHMGSARNACLPPEKKREALKEFWNSCWAETQEGEFIDAMDTVQKWCLAQIIAKDDSGVRCHFDGWSSRHDISYRWSSYKISPFRRFSKGYSGQHKTPLRQNMHFTPEFLRSHIDQMNLFI
jgi:hypothetical protein